MNRPNFTLKTRSEVSRILFDDNRAIGVEFATNLNRLGSGILGKPLYHTVKANKEVILSAGPYQTPKILMLSGIGPK